VRDRNRRSRGAQPGRAHKLARPHAGPREQSAEPVFSMSAADPAPPLLSRAEAIVLAACARRKVRHEGPVRRLPAGSRACAACCATEVSETGIPSFCSSPTIRRWPQRALSRTSRTTRTTTSGSSAGRPVLPCRSVHRRLIMWASERSGVAGLTQKALQRSRGRRWLSTASNVRSRASRRARAALRRRTPSSCRSTRISMRLRAPAASAMQLGPRSHGGI
jgi:hypothetical protein